MKNEVVFAAAGNGKTYDICRRAIELSKSTKKDILIITYTNEGKHSIEEEYCKLNFGIIDKNVIIKTWYSFLLSDLISMAGNLKDNVKINTLLKDVPEMIDIPSNITLRVSYKQKRDMEKLAFKLFWPQREEYRMPLKDK